MNRDTSSGKRQGARLFNRIAPVYAWFYHWQKKRFAMLLNSVPATVNLTLRGSVLDVGCGTGALCAALHEKGLQVCGVDPAARMLVFARKKSANLPIQFVRADVLQGLPFPDKQFDLSFASYVAHGLKPEDRPRTSQTDSPPKGERHDATNSIIDGQQHERFGWVSGRERTVYTVWPSVPE